MHHYPTHSLLPWFTTLVILYHVSPIVFQPENHYHRSSVFRPSLPLHSPGSSRGCISPPMNSSSNAAFICLHTRTLLVPAFTHYSFPRVPSFKTASVTASTVSPSRVACRHPVRYFYLFTSLFISSFTQTAQTRKGGHSSPAQSSFVAFLPELGVDFALERLPNPAHLWATPSRKQPSFVDGDLTVWRLLRFAWLLLEWDALHSFVSVGVF